MNIALVVLCLLVASCVVDATDKPRRCKDESQCDSGYCCVIRSNLRGKRSRTSNRGYGICQPYGTNGGSCYVVGPDITPPPGLSYDYCPCGDGLTCGGVVVNTYPLGPTGTCQLHLTAGKN